MSCRVSQLKSLIDVLIIHFHSSLTGWDDEIRDIIDEVNASDFTEANSSGSLWMTTLVPYADETLYHSFFGESSGVRRGWRISSSNAEPQTRKDSGANNKEKQANDISIFKFLAAFVSHVAMLLKYNCLLNTH